MRRLERQGLVHRKRGVIVDRRALLCEPCAETLKAVAAGVQERLEGAG